MQLTISSEMWRSLGALRGILLKRRVYLKFLSKTITWVLMTYIYVFIGVGPRPNEYALGNAGYCLFGAYWPIYIHHKSINISMILGSDVCSYMN